MTVTVTLTSQPRPHAYRQPSSARLCLSQDVGKHGSLRAPCGPNNFGVFILRLGLGLGGSIVRLRLGLGGSGR